MPQTANERMIAWLNDAYVMENKLVEVLKEHASQAEEHPFVRDKILEHCEETKHHASLVQTCIEQLGGDVASLKSSVAKVMGTMEGLTTVTAEDRLIKNAIAEYSSEYMEIGVYTALIAAADALNVSSIVPTLQTILDEETAMADWLEENLPTVVNQTIRLE